MLCFPRALVTAGKARRHGSVVAHQDLVQPDARGREHSQGAGFTPGGQYLGQQI